jgi:nicotinamide-nucleotide amidase
MFNADSGAPQAELITIGNEIISGLILDSNSNLLSRRLGSIGINVARISAVGDDEETITEALTQALSRADVIILTGGLGATHDDITKRVLALYFESNFITDKKVLKFVSKFFKGRGREVPDYALSQCEVPDNAVILYNGKGTAPGLLFEKEGKKVFALPGVPLEMEYLLEKYIIPELSKITDGRIEHRILRTTGITESSLWEKVGPIENLEKIVKVASLPSHLGVRIRLSVFGKDSDEIFSRLDEAEKILRDKIDPFIYGLDDETLEENLGKILMEKKLTLAVAESCTGGLIGHRLTNISGSSDYFLQGAVTYSNEAKEKRLRVDPELLKEHGAVSHDVALAMAEGVRATSGSDIGLAVTGIAGPTGGSEEKPVGLTFIALSDGKDSDCEKFLFPQDRVRNKERAAQAALNKLRIWLSR